MTRLVLLPGMDGTGELFAPFIAALDGWPTTVISYPPDREMEYAGHEAHARARLPLDGDYVLLAESFSGPVGIALAASRPRGLRGLILCASFAVNPLPRLAFMKPIVGAPAVLIVVKYSFTMRSVHLQSISYISGG